MDEPVHYPPNCLIENCPKCEADRQRIANLPTKITEVAPCGCTAESNMDGLWTIAIKGPECLLDIHVRNG